MDLLRQNILNLLSAEGYKPMGAQALAEALGNPDFDLLQDELEAMSDEWLILRTKKKKYALPSTFGLVVGRFRDNANGNFGFVTPEDGSPDLYVHGNSSLSAWDGDRVLVRVQEGRRGFGPAGVVEKIISRGLANITGVLTRTERRAYVTPDDRRLPPRVEVMRRSLGKARDGDKVSVGIIGYGEGKTPPKGRVEKSFGAADTLEAASAALLYKHGIHPGFSPDAQQQADATPEQLSPEELAGRLDLRGQTIITIDGASSKDLDDAVSLETLPEGWRLGVHIADVSHYVGWDTPLDQDAFARGTSVYYADRVVPMLPPRLSNGICSLNPQVDRLTLSCVMDLDKHGEVTGYTISNSVISTTHRMTYDDCNTLLAGSDPELAQRYSDIVKPLQEMARAADALYQRRLARGSVEIETVESKIICDEQGQPVDIQAAQRGRSEGIIEEFMLTANRTVAQHFFKKAKPNIYRVHPQPDDQKLAEFVRVAALLGYTVGRGKEHVTVADLAQVMKQATGKPEQRIIGMQLLRSMAKAFYSPKCGGHFGLAEDYYCHFTSPIRRYPDLVTHRMLKLLMEDKLSGALEAQATVFVAVAAEQSSQREVAADTAAREIEKLYMARFMQQHIGSVFEGIIENVHPFGFFVSLENTVEGLVRASTLPGGRYQFDENSLSLVDEATGASFKTGARVRVICVAANQLTGEIDFVLEE